VFLQAGMRESLTECQVPVFPLRSLAAVALTATKVADSALATRNSSRGPRATTGTLVSAEQKKDN